MATNTIIHYLSENILTSVLVVWRCEVKAKYSNSRNTINEIS